MKSNLTFEQHSSSLFWARTVGARLLNKSCFVILANFALPYEPTEEGDKPLYDEVIYADLSKEESVKIVEAYNKVWICSTCRWVRCVVVKRQFMLLYPGGSRKRFRK